MLDNKFIYVVCNPNDIIIGILRAKKKLPSARLSKQLLYR